MRSDTGTQWVEFQDAVKHPIVHRKLPIAKNYPAQIDNSVEIEKTLPQGEHLTSVAVIFLSWVAFQVVAATEVAKK